MQFRQAGFSALVLAHGVGRRAAFTPAQVISLNLHTRDLPSAGVRRVWQRFSPTITTLAQEALVYQKIDSTLRGHPVLEVRLLLNLLGLSVAIIAPAFPKLGRHTIDGVHRVHGVPLIETEYARKRARLQASSSLPEMFTETNGLPTAHLPWLVIERGVQEVARWLQEHLTEPGRLITADTAHEQHLDILTQAVVCLDQRVLLVGSAGWAERLALACRGFIGDVPPAPGVLGVVGSLSTVATRQVQTARQAGVTVIQCAPTRIDADADLTSDNWQRLTQTLTQGQHVILWTHPDDGVTNSDHSGQQMLRRLAAAVRAIMSTTAVSGLVIVGGDTAQHVLRAVRASGLRLSGEIAAGVPYGRLVGGAFAGLPVATKAGGFGMDMVLRDCLDSLRHWAAQ